MKEKKIIIGIIVILLLVTSVLAIIHFNTRDKVPEGALMLSYQGKTTFVEWDDLSLTEITGTIVNGKGEEKTVMGQGLALFSLAPGEVHRATVVAEDEFSATVGIEDGENAYLILSEDGSARLMVFGDANAKRDVKHVVKVDFQ